VPACTAVGYGGTKMLCLPSGAHSNLKGADTYLRSHTCPPPRHQRRTRTPD